MGGLCCCAQSPPVLPPEKIQLTESPEELEDPEEGNNPSASPFGSAVTLIPSQPASLLYSGREPSDERVKEGAAAASFPDDRKEPVPESNSKPQTQREKMSGILSVDTKAATKVGADDSTGYTASEPEDLQLAKEPVTKLPSRNETAAEGGPSTLSPLTKKKSWPRPETKMPQYSAGGPRSLSFQGGGEREGDPFEPPDIGHACYLTYSPTHNGSLKLQYSLTTANVSERIIGAAKLQTEVQAFKYKSATLTAKDIFTKPDAFFRAIGSLLRVARQNESEVFFYALPPGFPAFVVVYAFSDESVILQYAGGDPVTVTHDCWVVLVADPVAVETMETASKINYHVFKMQLIDPRKGCMIDFIKD